MQSRIEKQRGSYPFRLIGSWVYLNREDPSMCIRCGNYAEYIQEHYINIFQIRRMESVGIEQKKAIDIAWNVARDEQMQGVYCCAGTTRLCWDCLVRQIGAVNPIIEMTMGTLRL